MTPNDVEPSSDMALECDTTLGNDTTLSAEGDASCWASQWTQEDGREEATPTEETQVEEWEQEVFDP